MLESPYLNVRDAASFLSVVSKSTLDHLRVKGGGPRFIKLGRNVAYDRADLVAWAEEQKRTSTSDTGTN